ncbi:MAG: hypothetical protein OJF52_001419 [Nitrospira sp.]|jgi:hypothetical protein|nr:MAG: hypothetical protein OJF52_001419 [Nitrospira sp.]
MLFIAVILAYMLLLTGLAVASPGIGFTGSLIFLVPESWRDWSHVPAYGLLTWLVMQGFRLRDLPITLAVVYTPIALLVMQGFRLRDLPVPYAMFAGILWTVMFGLWTEVAQGSAPGRETSWHDVLNDTVGGLMVAMLMLWQQKTPGLSSRVSAMWVIDSDRFRKGV